MSERRRQIRALRICGQKGAMIAACHPGIVTQCRAYRAEAEGHSKKRQILSLPLRKVYDSNIKWLFERQGCQTRSRANIKIKQWEWVGTV